MGKEISVPQSMKSWCAGLYEYGKLGNTNTGYEQDLMVHITVTKSNAHAGLGFHVSAYVLGSGGKVLNDYDPRNALSKLYFKPGAPRSGECPVYPDSQQWGPKFKIIKDMPSYNLIAAQGIEFFISKYPAYKKEQKLVINDTEFPALGS